LTPETVATDAPIDLSGSSFSDIRKMMAGEEVAAKAVEKPAVSEVAAETSDAAESTVTESDTVKKEVVAPVEETTPESKTGIEKRFSKLTKTIRDLEAKLAVKAPEVKPAVATPEPALTAPKQEDFSDWEAYSDALVEHKVKLIESRKDGEAKARVAQEQQAALEAKLISQTDSARVKYEDFDDVALNPELPVTPVMLHVLQSSDNGAELLYHLGSNPDVSAKIAAMSPGAAALAIGRLEAKLFPDEQPKPAVVEKAAVAPKVLPKPPATVGNTATPSRHDLNDPNIPFGEFKTLYAKSLKKK